MWIPSRAVPVKQKGNDSMKRIIALGLTLCLLVAVLASCGNSLSGVYTADAFGSKLTYEFSGDKVTLRVSVLGVQAASIQGTYKISGSSITLSFGGDESEAAQYSGTFDFYKSDDGKTIKIGLIECQKQ